MIVDCPSCGATYNISDDKVRGRRVRVRCKTCGEGIIVNGATLDDATRVYSPNFEPAAYTQNKDKDEATRVMSPSGMEWREAAPGDWTVNLSDTEQRAMSLREIVSGYNTGELGDDAYVWRDGMPEWSALREVPEIRAALESGESTRVMSQAALRAVAGPPPVAPAPLATPPPAPAPPAASPSTRAAIARSVAPPTPVSYAAPTAPPRSLRAEPPPAASVEYASSPGRFAPAHVRENRARADLFGGSPDASAEDELLRSSSVPLEQYDDKPTGARNESSVLFSLDTLKAGARRGGATSAPPRMVAASPPTAADILGMTAGIAPPGMDSNAMLLTAPSVETPAPIPTTAPQVRDRDTTPPTMRAKLPLGLIGAVVALALAVLAGAFVVLRSRISPEPSSPRMVASSTPAPVVSAAPVLPATPVAVPPTPAPAPSAAPGAAGASVLAPPVAAPPVAAAPLPAATKATPPASGSSLEAMKAAIRPDNAEKAEASEPGADKKPDPGASKSGKVVLAEEPSAGTAEAPAEEKTDVAPKPPFDTGAAKAALASAAAGAAACKKPDGPTGSGKVQITFSPSGNATSANISEGAFGGTTVGGCVAKVFRAARVPAFSGDPVTVSKSFSIPE